MLKLFGFTVPFNTAEVDVIELAAVVVTVGATFALVRKLRIDPLDVPPLFCPTTR